LAATRGCLRRRRSLRAGSPTGRHLATGGCLAASADTTGCAGGRGDTLACVRDLLALLDLLLTLLIRPRVLRIEAGLASICRRLTRASIGRGGLNTMIERMGSRPRRCCAITSDSTAARQRNTT